jgi:hypothetical protein
MFLRTLLLIVGLCSSAFAQSPGLQSGEGKREQEWRIPTASGAPIWHPLVEDVLKSVK